VTEPPIVRVEGLEKSFGSTVALAGVDLEVLPGTVFGLLGRNGAGKSTLVRILATLLQPDAGRASIAGADVVRQSQMVRSLIGFAGQYAAVDETLTGRENLELVGRLYGLRNGAARKRAADTLQRLSLTAAADRQVRTYSGGMRRRLDLGASLVGYPILLVLDEPTTGLDPLTRIELWTFIEELVGEGTTVILTTQYLEEADQLADRVGIIDFGRIVAEDTPRRLKAQIGHPHLEIRLVEGSAGRAEEVVARFGRPLPSRDGAVLVELEGGAAKVAPVVRALDDAGLTVEALDLVEPTLDDVFVAKTGHHLEPEEGEATEAQ
jgi:daunorubicin resistance ABC transporter ATP-binding subunit